MATAASAAVLILAACGDSGTSPSSNLAVSSSSLWKANWQYLNPDISYGEMTDARDGQVYKTVQIGEQTWMAENLNYRGDDSDTLGVCYNFDESKCDLYGRLYTWDATMAGCPEGWHLPDMTEWDLLKSYVAGKADAVGTALKTVSGWNDGFPGEPPRNGTDVFGFSALPGGDLENHSGTQEFFEVGSAAYFWTTLTSSGSFAFCNTLSSFATGLLYANQEQNRAFSVRCIKDSL